MIAISTVKPITMTITMARNHQGDSGLSSAGLTIALLAGVGEVAVMTGSLCSLSAQAESIRSNAERLAAEASKRRMRLNRPPMRDFRFIGTGIRRLAVAEAQNTSESPRRRCGRVQC